jgi:hypothetical protein
MIKLKTKWYNIIGISIGLAYFVLMLLLGGMIHG